MSALAILILGSNILQGIFWTVLMEKLLKVKKHNILNNTNKLVLISIGMIFIFANIKGQKVFTYYNAYDSILVMVMSILIIFCFHYNQFILKKMLLSIMIIAVTATTVVITGVGDITLSGSIALASWIITIIFSLCYGIQKLKYHYAWDWGNSDVKVYTVTFACSIYSVIKIVSYYYFKSMNEKMKLVEVWTCGLLGVSLVLYYIVGTIYDSYEKLLEKKLIELSYEQNEYSADNIRHMYEEAAKMRHDIKNCITIVDNCIANEDYDDARKYMSSLVEEKVDALGINIYCSNKVLNYIINHKFSVCQKKKIETKCIISTNLERISDVDLSILIGNLLDNAIEAAQKASGGMVAIEIYEEYGSTIIIVENTISESVIKNNHTFLTTKQDKSMHGFGMISIRDIVNKYRGSIEYSEDGNVLNCQVVLNEKIPKSSYY